MKSGIYCIKNKKTKDLYIGSSCDINKRWSVHRNALKKNKHHSIILQRAWNKYKSHSFLFMVLEECLPKDCLKLEETYLVKYHPTYNITLSAIAPMSGRKHSKSTLKKFKQRKVLKGKDSPTYGLKWSKEQRNKILLARMGYKHSEKTKKKQRIAAIKRNAHLILLPYIEKMKRKIKDSQGNIFNSLTDAAKFWETTPASVCDCLKGRSIAIRKGIQFKYLEK